jgi:methyl-accepting chemotaxis protein
MLFTYQKSLARRILLPLVGIVLALIAIIVVVVYSFVQQRQEQQVRTELESYMGQRLAIEQSVFTLARDNLTILRDAALNDLKKVGTFDPKAEFDYLFEKLPDGTTRSNRELFNGKKNVGVFLGRNVDPDLDLRQRVLILQKLIGQYGPPWLNRFINTYFGLPENGVILYWPDYPNWVLENTANYQAPAEEWLQILNRQNNPERKFACTGQYYDTASKSWLISCGLPVEIDGRYVAGALHDIQLDVLLKRTNDQKFRDSYNLIFRKDGRLIAYEPLNAQLRDKNGQLKIQDSGDPNLQNIYNLVTQNNGRQIIIDDAANNRYLAVGQLEGPDWYFVTVFSKEKLNLEVVTRLTFIALATSVFFVSVLSLLFYILNRLVSRPLRELTQATGRIAAGDLEIQLDTRRQDELGELAQSFNRMAQAVSGRNRKLSEVGQTVLSQATELKVAAEQQATGSQSQASAVAQSDAFVTSLSKTAQNIATIALAVKNSAGQVETESREIIHTTELTANQSQRGLQAVERTLEVSVAAAEMYQELTVQMDDLKTKSGSMRQILNLLSTIANETHLLALNASIEAAGAGEAGNRFGVVAQEVRSLAERSRRASQQVVALIEQMEQTTDNVLSSAESSYSKTRELGSAVADTEQVIKELTFVAAQAQEQSEVILVAAQELKELGYQIEQGTGQQEQLTRQVLQTLNGLTVGARQNADGSRLVSTSAEHLEKVSQNLNEALIM